MCKHILAGHLERIHCVAFDPSGRFLGSASDDGTCILWDLERSEPRDVQLDGIKPPADLLQATLASSRKAIAEGQAVTNLRPFEGGKKKNKSGGGQGSGGGKRKKEAP